MKVLCYYPWIYLRSGIERTMLEHAKRSRHDVTFITNHFDAKGTFPEFSRFRVEQLPLRVSVRRSLRDVAVAALKISISQLGIVDHDVLLVHCDGLGNLVLFANHQEPAVCFCHTPLRIAYDSVYISKQCDGKKVHQRIIENVGKVYRAIDRRAWRHYDHVFFNSHEVRQRCRRFGLDLCKSSILRPGIDERLSPESTCREAFFLCAGRIMWTKNIESAILGFGKAKTEKTISEDMRLVIAGMVDKKSVSYLGDLKSLAADRGDIIFIETPSDNELFDLYRRCFAFIFPAFNEDWGIVPLEAMLHGKVVISSNMGGPKESVIPGKTGWLVNPNAEGIASGIKQCLDHEKELDVMAEHCINRAKEFTWERFTLQMDDTIEMISLASASSRMTEPKRTG